jgi:hypothetical protein
MAESVIGEQSEFERQMWRHKGNELGYYRKAIDGGDPFPTKEFTEAVCSPGLSYRDDKRIAQLRSSLFALNVEVLKVLHQALSSHDAGMIPEACASLRHSGNTPLLAVVIQI